MWGRTTSVANLSTLFKKWLDRQNGPLKFHCFIWRMTSVTVTLEPHILNQSTNNLLSLSCSSIHRTCMTSFILEEIRPNNTFRPKSNNTQSLFLDTEFLQNFSWIFLNLHSAIVLVYVLRILKLGFAPQHGRWYVRTPDQRTNKNKTNNFFLFLFMKILKAIAFFYNTYMDLTFCAKNMAFSFSIFHFASRIVYLQVVFT